MKLPISTTCCLLLLAIYTYGQMDNYDYKRQLTGISEEWHTLVLPDDIFGKTSQNLSDIRIFGITKNKDTLEAPYLLQIAEDKRTMKNVPFNMLNTVNNAKGYYFTFEIPSEETINHIQLDFAQKNFDWTVVLEGSQNQKQWFTLVEDYRILSIKNDETDFQFTKLVLPSTKYQYFRLLVKSGEQPKLNGARIEQSTLKEGMSKNFSIREIRTQENKRTKQTEIDVTMEMPVRLGTISLEVSDSFDYYRPISIQYLKDSVKTEKGWKYSYSNLTSGILNSIQKEPLRCNHTTVKKLKILIDNQDNQPLQIKTVKASGFVHNLVTRLSTEAEYYIAYGNETTSRPTYDIDRFTSNIPENLGVLELGPEQEIKKEEIEIVNPLFQNKIWLWSLMIVIIALLGWFSIKMIRNG